MNSSKIYARPQEEIQMVDLNSQYLKIKTEIDREIEEVLESTRFIGGQKLIEFSNNLSNYLGVKHVIPCANGTDALQIALMALELEKGDEIIVPSFTYVATAEVISLLGLKPVMIDVERGTFNINRDLVLDAITPRTKAVIIVHLFGQCTEMDGILDLAEEKGIYTIEDNAQAIGSEYKSKSVGVKKAGTMATIGTTSFFPSKNLGCYGDGGAMFTNDNTIAKKLKMISNHGQEKRYFHKVIGCNSRLDAIQAGVLNVKLKYLDKYCEERAKVAKRYDLAFREISDLEIPERNSNSTHVFHQYTLKVLNGKRDELIVHLKAIGVPSMIYYPVPLYKQEAFRPFTDVENLPVTESLCKTVMSLPIHSEMKDSDLEYIIQSVKSFPHFG
jgi:dTDP-4-amino-4,6-dideoxygalactose transaminase